VLVVLGITMTASGFGFSLLNGLGAASQAALNADVLPKNSDNAARDMQLIQTTPVLLPGILIPLVVGSAWGSLGARPYHVLYTGAACVACVALVVLWNIPVDGDEDTRSATHRAGRRRPPPRGALCCDRVLFGRIGDESSSEDDYGLSFDDGKPPLS
jgi:hypothetical protein